MTSQEDQMPEDQNTSNQHEIDFDTNYLEALSDGNAYIPPSFGRSPETAQDVLLSAAALLEEEGRWTQCIWYNHLDQSADEYSDDPYCNGWAACADGALQIVSIGLYKIKHHTSWITLTDDAYVRVGNRNNITNKRRIYSEARDLFQKKLEEKYPGKYGGVEDYNDNVDSRDDVISLMKEAAAAND